MPMPKPVDGIKRKYGVNVLVDNSALKGAPVVLERNPNYNNLFGRVEQQAQLGALITDFSLIRPGSLHRANGGYLVLPAEQLLANPFAWESLKRALANGELRVYYQPKINVNTRGVVGLEALVSPDLWRKLNGPQPGRRTLITALERVRSVLTLLMGWATARGWHFYTPEDVEKLKEFLRSTNPHYQL